MGALWPLTPPQIGQYAAVITGLAVLLLLGRRTDRRSATVVVVPSLVLLALTHTRTATLGLLVGLLLAIGSLFLSSAAARRFFTWTVVVAAVAAVGFGSALQAWFLRGQDEENFSSLTGRAKVWHALLDAPRTVTEQVFGTGLGDKSFDGLPIDNSWLAVYHEQGLLGVSLIAAALLVLGTVALLRPPSLSRACALFLISYCALASYTEAGLGDASPYLLHLAVAASLLVPPAPAPAPRRRPPPRTPPRGRPDPRADASRAGPGNRRFPDHARARGAQPLPLGAAQRREQGRRPGGGAAARGRPRGRAVPAAQRRHRRPLPLGKAAVPLLVPWNPAVRREFAARLRAERPDVVHVHNVFPLLSPAVLAACADAGVPAVATLHNYTQICPPGTLQREGRPCTECVGSSPLPAVRHGCYRDSRVATVPLAVSLSVNRRRWWTGVERFFCISAAQREVLVRGGCRPNGSR